MLDTHTPFQTHTHTLSYTDHAANVPLAWQVKLCQAAAVGDLETIQVPFRAHPIPKVTYPMSKVASRVTSDAKYVTFRTLATNGVDLSAGDYDGRTALHLAAAEEK
eukprot:3699951-Rhodomonas_salina.1